MKKKCTVLLRGARLYTMNRHQEIIHDGAVAIEADTICAVGPHATVAAAYEPATTLDLSEQLILPGLINGHTHAAMNLFRGYAEIMPLASWLKKIAAAEQKILTEAAVYGGTKLALLELMRNGVTTIVDMYWYQNGTARACAELGMRAIVAPTVLHHFHEIKTTEEFITHWRGHPLIIPACAPHSVATVSLELLHAAAELAQKYTAPLIMHLSETAHDADMVQHRYGTSAVALLEREKLLSSATIFAHGVHLTATEIALLARAKAGIIHCPTSNLKLASGIAPLTQLLEAGCLVGLGTDGAASNNSLNLIAEMKLATLLQRIKRADQPPLTALRMLGLATSAGAAAIHLDHLIGSIEVGKKADLISVRQNSVHQIPVYDPAAMLVHASYPADVQTVLIGGKLMVAHGELTLPTEQINEIICSAEEYRQQIASLER